MEWFVPKSKILKVNMYNIPHKAPKPIKNIINEWRSDILEERGYICHCCGGKYPKYMRFLNIATLSMPIDGIYMRPYYNKDDMGFLCTLCHIITTLSDYCSLWAMDSLFLCRSKISQLDIVRISVEYMTKYKCAPPIHYIDPDATYASISILEYTILYSLLDSYTTEDGELYDIISGYKIFFNKDLNVAFIDAICIPEFTSEKLVMAHSVNNNTEKEVLTPEQLAILKKHLVKDTVHIEHDMFAYREIYKKLYTKGCIVFGVEALSVIDRNI